MLLRSSEVKSPADAERIKQCSTSSYVNVITEPYEIKLAYRTSMCGYLGFSVDVSYHVSGLINFWHGELYPFLDMATGQEKYDEMS